MTIDRYDVNDALTALAGGRLDDDSLNELTHVVADAIDAGSFSTVTDENDVPIVRLPGSLKWENGYKYGQALEETFPGQGGYDLRAAMEHNTLGPVSETNGIVGLVMTQQGERDAASWVWRVTMQDGSVWFAEGWCDYTGWDCQSGLTWTRA